MSLLQTETNRYYIVEELALFGIEPMTLFTFESVPHFSNDYEEWVYDCEWSSSKKTYLVGYLKREFPVV